MRKLLFVLLAILVSGSVFGQGQEYTFQELPWGSTKEQVIAKLGNPITRGNVYDSRGSMQDYLDFDASVIGYMSLLTIIFDNIGMSEAHYDIGSLDRLNISQLETLFLIMARQLTEKYGSYSEIIATSPLSRDNKERLVVWHFNNYHILIMTIVSNSKSLFISYFSDLAWHNFEAVIISEKWPRFPNHNF